VIRFKNEVEYKKAHEEIKSTCIQKVGLKNSYNKISKNKRIIYYVSNNEQLVILAFKKYLKKTFVNVKQKKLYNNATFKKNTF
jgi:hypothetical protein